MGVTATRPVRGLVVAISILLLQACTTPVINEQATMADRPTALAFSNSWYAVLGPDRPVRFQGQPSQFNHDGGSNAGNGYFAPDVLSLAIVMAIQSTEHSNRSQAVRDERAAAEDAILDPYRAVLPDIRLYGLVEPALMKIEPYASIAAEPRPEEHSATPAMVVNAVFSMASDERAIYLDLLAANAGLAQDNELGFRHRVRVISDAAPTNETSSARQWWLDGRPTNLHQVSAELMETALELLMKDFRGHLPRDTKADFTVRYPVGGTKTVERATLINRSCDRQIVRTLRGWILSAPVLSDSQTGSQSDSHDSCFKAAETQWQAQN